jgi:hypothetical protein
MLGGTIEAPSYTVRGFPLSIDCQSVAENWEDIEEQDCGRPKE